jgi:CRISPR-associated protein Csm5
MTTVFFHAVPLTPIHIGDGSHLSPEDFLIESGELLRFSPTRVIADMPPARQQKLIDAVAAGKLKDAQALVRQSVNRDQHVFERIAVGPEARDYLQKAITNPDRRGEASPFMRMAGRPFVPGSSLKGAFRTALVSERANAKSAAVGVRIGARLETLHSPQSGEISDSLQQIALDYSAGATEGDPLRDVSIADARLGPGATRFDKVTVGWTPNPKKADDKKKGRQLHVERLLSVIDRCPPGDVAFTLALTITDEDRQQQRQRLNGAKTPRAPVHLRSLLEAAHAFHVKRWEDEMERLFPEGSTVRRRLENARKNADAYARTLAPSALDGIPTILLRLGRFTGFEAKSVETWRRGWAPQTKKLLTRAGTHSMVVDGGDILPFGWLLLCPASAPVAERTAPPRIGGAPAAAADKQTAPSRPAAPAAPPRRAFVDEQEVTIVEKKGGEVFVRFLDSNDTEWIDEAEIRYE